MTGDRPERPRETSETGRQGEEIAARYLEGRGCTVLARNWQANPGEVDIVAECPSQSGFNPGGRELAFAEVRTRHGRQGLAEESISRRKAGSMVAAAYSYMEAHNLDPEATHWRIDLIAIAMEGSRITSINWIQGALDEDML